MTSVAEIMGMAYVNDQKAMEEFLALKVKIKAAERAINAAAEAAYIFERVNPCHLRRVERLTQFSNSERDSRKHYDEMTSGKMSRVQRTARIFHTVLISLARSYIFHLEAVRLAVDSATLKNEKLRTVCDFQKYQSARSNILDDLMNMRNVRDAVAHRHGPDLHMTERDKWGAVADGVRDKLGGFVAQGGGRVIAMENLKGNVFSCTHHKEGVLSEEVSSTRVERLRDMLLQLLGVAASKVERPS